MRSGLLVLGLVALTGCDDLFQTNDHEYDFPQTATAPPPSTLSTINVPPKPPSRPPVYTFDPYGATQSKASYISIEAGDHYTCAIRPNDQIDCWGDTLTGQPLYLTEVSGSAKTACGLDPANVLRCWGAAEGFDAPIGERLSAVGVGDGFACALDPSGHPHCWGPKAIAAPATETLTELAVGVGHACGLHADGTAVCWGVGPTETPKERLFGIAAGAGTTCGIVIGTREVRCWGLLDGTFGGGITSVAVTMGKACGIRADDRQVECWGLSPNGDDWLTPPGGIRFWKLAIGPTHACGIRNDNGLALCWGSNTAGESRPPY